MLEFISNIKILDGKRILLKPISMEDVTEKYCSWLNNKKITDNLVTKKTNLEELKKYVQDKINSTDCMFFVILYKSDKNLIHIGNVKLEPVDYINKITTLGLLLGEIDYHGKGIGTEVIKLIILFLKKYNFKKIFLGVEKANIAAINLYKKVGFKIYEEGDIYYKMMCNLLI